MSDTVNLGGIPLNANLHLTGGENNREVSYSVRELLGGPDVIQVEPRSVGTEFRLVARHSGSSKMGTYCQHQLESLHALSAAGAPVTLVHPKGTYKVYIFEFNVEQSDEREAPGPYKKFHGYITLQEVRA